MPSQYIRRTSKAVKSPDAKHGLVYECTAQVVDRETDKVEREFKATHPIETEAERLAVDQATAFIKNLKP
jgi:hypothetical protein